MATPSNETLPTPLPNLTLLFNSWCRIRVLSFFYDCFLKNEQFYEKKLMREANIGCTQAKMEIKIAKYCGIIKRVKKSERKQKNSISYVFNEETIFLPLIRKIYHSK